MRKLSVGCLVALNGVVASPEVWALPFFDEECVEYSMAQLADVDMFSSWKSGLPRAVGDLGDAVSGG
jgi:hypothetical protein